MIALVTVTGWVDLQECQKMGCHYSSFETKKKKDPTLIKSHRPITLLNTVYKIAAKEIVSRPTNWFLRNGFKEKTYDLV